MTRWELTIEGFNTKPLIYAETPEKAKKVFSSEKVTEVKLYINNEYLKYIQEMKDKSILLNSRTTRARGKQEWYKYQSEDGTLRFRLYRDSTDEYYDIAEYQFMSKNSFVYPCTFTYSNPKDVYNLFFTQPMTCEIYSYRFYGQPKLSKPKELSGVKQSFSVDYIPKKCACQCFVKGDDLWVKHRDFFSAYHKPLPEDNGTPLSYRAKKYFGIKITEKFNYADSWGEIVLRNEAWMVFRNIKSLAIRNKTIPNKTIVQSFLNTELLKKHCIYDLDEGWERFFEEMCKKYRDFIISK